MKVTVAIPAYNRPEYLRLAIASVVTQSFQDWELLIVDDASPTDLKPTINQFQDPRVRYYRNETNVGYVRNWNRCLELAAGEYVLLLMDDDLLKPKIIDSYAHILDNNPSVGFVCSRVEIIDQGGHRATIQSESYRFFQHDQHESGVDFIKTYFLKHRPIGVPSSVMFRKSLAFPPGFNPVVGFAADIEMWLRLALKSDFFYLDQVLCCCRVHPEGISSAITMKNIFGYRELYRLVDSIFRNHLPNHRELISELRPVQQSAYWNVTAAAVAQITKTSDGNVKKMISDDIVRHERFLLNRLQAKLLTLFG